MVALLEVAVLLRELVLEEIVEEGAERVLAPEGEVEGIALLDVKLLEITVDVETDPVLEPPREVELVTVVEEVKVVESPAELPATVEVPLALEVPEPELPVMPSRIKVPDQP